MPSHEDGRLYSDLHAHLDTCNPADTIQIRQAGVNTQERDRVGEPVNSQSSADHRTTGDGCVVEIQ